MSRLRTYAPMKRRSEKVTKAAPDFRAVYTVVDARSEGRCEYNLLPEWRPLVRCRRRASDHHHLYTPRRSHHDPALIVHLCRHHHDRASWPFKRGRLIVALRNGTHTFTLVFADDKFAARSGATAG
jgi:hypothetical protein